MTKYCHHRYEPPQERHHGPTHQEVATVVLLICVLAIATLAAVAVARALAETLVAALVAVQ